MMEDGLIWVEGQPFEDTIDGYFPLQVSLAQMLERNGLSAAVVTISFAPIMHIPGLPPGDPVPLNIRSGYAGLIDDLSLCVTPEKMSGFGMWRWLTPGLDRGTRFDPTTRLAEPAYLSGIGFKAGTMATEHLGPIRHSSKQDVCLTDGAPPKLDRNDKIWGPFPNSDGIAFIRSGEAAHGAEILLRSKVPGTYVVQKSFFEDKTGGLG